MKKQYEILIVAGLLIAILSPTTIGAPEEDLGEDVLNLETEQDVQTGEDLGADSGNDQDDGYGISAGDCPQKRLVFHGIWGFQDDNSSDGSVAGRLIKRWRFMVFYGFCNSTGTQERARLVGIIRNGYFNGKIFRDNDTTWPITGLLTINREQRLVKLRWMTPYQTGWAVAKMSLVDV